MLGSLSIDLRLVVLLLLVEMMVNVMLSSLTVVLLMTMSSPLLLIYLGSLMSVGSRYRYFVTLLTERTVLNDCSMMMVGLFHYVLQIQVVLFGILNVALMLQNHWCLLQVS